MNNIEKQNLIISKLLKDNWNIESVSYTGRCELIATKKYAKISITTEECLCHGGRIKIDDYIFLSLSEEEKEKGYFLKKVEIPEFYREPLSDNFEVIGNIYDKGE